MQNTDTEPQPDQPVVPGDPRLRQWTLLLAAAMLLTGLAALWLLRTALADLEQLAQRDLPAAVNRTLRLVMGIAVLGSAGMVGCAAWLWFLARKIRRSGRFPPPGMKVIKDTPLRQGPQAQSMAARAQVAAVLLLTLGTAAMWYLYHLATAALRLQ